MLLVRILLATLTLMLLASSAHAQMSVDERRAGARAAFMEGLRLQEEGRFDLAVARFRAAQELHDAPTHLLHIGQCLAAMGKVASAAESYELVVRKNLPEGSPEAFVQAQEEARAELPRVRERVPSLLVRTAPDPSSLKDLVLDIDGRSYPPQIVAIARPVDPGRYVLRATADGFASATMQIDVEERAAKTVLLELKPVPRESSHAERWRGAVGGGTDFPLAVGLRAHVEAPFRVRASMSLGILPGPYVDAINAFVTGVGGYSDATADLVKAALTSSLIWRTHVGYRPFASLGLYVEGGYGFVGLGGSATAAALISGVTGRPLPEDANPRNDGQPREFDVRSALHMLDVEVGYDFAVAPHLQLRVALGGAFTVASSTSIEPKFATAGSGRGLEAFIASGEQYLDDTYTSYVFTPVLSASGAYAF